jgi:hypothetical protein
MFVRFRQQGNRLQASLMQTRRVAGKVQAEHIASLGAVDASMSVRERLAFWAKMPDHMARLGNRVAPDDQAKIFGALHARIPMVTPDDQRAIQEENAKDDEQFWGSVHDMNAELVEGNKALVAKVEATIAEVAPQVQAAAERRDIAKARLEKIKRGETVAGGLGKRIDFEALLNEAGWTSLDFRRARLMKKLTEAEFDEALANMKVPEEHDRAFDREARRILRARHNA